MSSNAAGERRKRRTPLVAWLLVLGGLLVAADLAPVVASTTGRGGAAAAACRFAIGRTCHQRPERSLGIAGARLACCARCTGLHVGGLLGGLLLVGVPGVAAFGRRGRGIVLTASGLLAADVVAGAAWPAWDHPILRFATGAVLVLSVVVAVAGEAR